MARSSAKTNKNGNIYYLKLLNEKFVPCAIRCLKKIQILFLHSTPFNDPNCQLPSIIESLPNSLKHLDIDNVPVSHLPKEIAKLTKVKTLKITNAGLVSIPDEIANLTSLTNLDLSNNSITELPPIMTNIPKLLHLNLNDNFNLLTIETINGHSSLRSLQTNNCPIKELPQDLPQLTDLHMSNNKLIDIIGIPTLGYKTNVKKSFYLTKNLIVFVPSQINLVINLFLLDLRDNHLRDLHPNIFYIKTLHFLCISNNFISINDKIMNKNADLKIC